MVSRVSGTALLRYVLRSLIIYTNVYVNVYVNVYIKVYTAPLINPTNILAN